MCAVLWDAAEMPISYHPKIGTILICDYSRGFLPPEMVKVRPCIVISPRLRRRTGLCTVVPLSTSPPDLAMDYHCLITLERPLPRPFSAAEMWAKCDMVATVSFERLSLIRVGGGKHIAPELPKMDIERIRAALIAGLGLGDLLSGPGTP